MAKCNYYGLNFIICPTETDDGKLFFSIHNCRGPVGITNHPIKALEIAATANGELHRSYFWPPTKKGKEIYFLPREPINVTKDDIMAAIIRTRTSWLN